MIIHQPLNYEVFGSEHDPIPLWRRDDFARRSGLAFPFSILWRRFFLADMMGITYDEPTIDYGNGDIVGGHVMGDIANDIPSGYLI